jgi:hypothetical protein
MAQTISQDALGVIQSIVQGGDVFFRKINQSVFAKMKKTVQRKVLTQIALAL